MSTLSDAQRPHASGVEPLRAKCGWIVALGVVYVVAGLIALSSIVLATAATVFLVGIMMVVAGVAEVINAFQFKSWGKFLLWIVLGLLYIVAGFVAFENPLLTAAVLSMKEGMPWMWVVLSGVITLLLGAIILARWPVSSLYILGLFLGIDLVFAGVGWIFVGLGLKSRA